MLFVKQHSKEEVTQVTQVHASARGREHTAAT